MRHNLFLAFEEALNNVLKHSAATKVKVEMNAGAKEFELKVVDNGKGFETVAPSAAREPARGGRGGNGLKNMRQRLAAIGGECLVLSQDAQGTAVIMRIPLELENSRTMMKKIITVSIVDDDADLREHIAGYLAATGNIRCKSAYASGEEALKHLPQTITRT